MSYIEGGIPLIRRLLAAIAVTATVLVTPGPTVHATTTHVPAFSTVFVIVGENTSLSQLDRKSAPFQLGWVKPHSAWLTDYWGLSHWSTSNYIGMTSGQFLRCHQLDLKPAECNQDVPNIFGQLSDARIPWLAWNESMPEPCSLVNAGASKDGNSYRVKHNAAAYYADVVQTDFQGATGSASCRDHVITMGTTGYNDTSLFEAALAAPDPVGSGALGRFNYIVPNQCEDGHDNCKPQGNPIRQFDDFLAREIPLIMASDAWDAHAAIFVVYDEGQDGGPGKAKTHAGGHVPFAVIGPDVHEALYPDFANHYNLLRTLEEGFGFTTFAGEAANVDPIDQIWTP